MDHAPLTINWRKNLIFVGLSQFLAMAGFGCCMPFIPLLLRENLHIVNDSVRGIYVSIYYLSGMVSLCIATTVWGILADRFGRKIMLLRASYAAAVFYPLLAFAPNVWILIVIRFVCSFFSGTVNPAQTLLVSTTPEDKHGFVLGTLSTSVWSGNMLGYLMGGVIVECFSYRTAFLTCGVIYLISGLLVQIFARENFVRPERTTAGTVRKSDSQYTFCELATPAVIWLMLLFLLMGISRRIEQPFIAEQVVIVHGRENAGLFTGVLSAVAALGGVISGVVTGYLCDRMPPRKLLIPVLLFSGSATLIQAFSPNLTTLILSRFATYLIAGGLQPILQVMLTKVTPPELKGTFFGWSGSISTGGGILCSFLSAGIVYYLNVRWIFAAGGILLLCMIPLTFPTVRACRKEFLCDPDATARDLQNRYGTPVITPGKPSE